MKKINKINMKAAVLDKLNAPLKILKVDLPEYLDFGQVLVKIHYSGICGSQIGEINGVKGPDKYLPHLLGHEGSGTVIETGKGVKFIKNGEKVILHWRKSQGIDSKTPVYYYKGKKINAGFVTTFNEYAIVSENRLTKLNHSFDLIKAPLLGCSLTTGFGVVENNANIRVSESVVIYGSGSLGLSMVIAASVAGAYPIIAIDCYKNKLILAKKLGASHIIQSNNYKIILSKIKKILNKDELNTFIDNTGNPKIIELGYNLIDKKGKLILVGVPNKKDKIKIHTLPMHFGKKIIGSEGGDSKPEIDIPRIIKLIKNKKIKLDNIISKIYTLDNINKAIKDVKTGKIDGKCIIKL